MKSPGTHNGRCDSRGGVWLFVIGAGKLLKAVVMICLALAAHKLAKSNDGYSTLLHGFQRIRIDPDNRFAHAFISRILRVPEQKLELLSAGTYLYGALFAVEGVGLLLRRYWAEWLTVITTALLVPIEMYEIFHHATIARFAILILNLAVVAYLWWRLRRHECDLRQASGMTMLQRHRSRLKRIVRRPA